MENAPSTARPDFAKGRWAFACSDQAARTAFFKALSTRRAPEPGVAPVLSSMALKPGWEHLYFRLQVDTDLARLVGFVRHDSVSESRAWIIRERRAGRQLYAVMHAQHGMVGVYGLRCWGEVATFYFWLGKAFRGLGYGGATVALMKQQAEVLGVRRLYSTVLADNSASLRVLRQLGFRCIAGLEDPVRGLSQCLYGALGTGPQVIDDVVLHEELGLLLAAAGLGAPTDLGVLEQGVNG